MKLSNAKHRMTIHLDPSAIATAGITPDGWGATAAIRRYCLQLELAAAQVEKRFSQSTWTKFINAVTENTLAAMDEAMRPATSREMLLAELLATYPKITSSDEWARLEKVTDMEAEAIVTACRYYYANKKKISFSKDTLWYTVAFRRRRAENAK